jgi:hypothetical protein
LSSAVPQYQVLLKAHLANYAAGRLGVREAGVYRGRAYRHILPYRLRFLNLLESYRAELQEYLSEHRTVQLHRYFHHLNSSQALTFNLFFPFLADTELASPILTGALDVPEATADWQFEFVPEAAEGTSVDVTWCTPEGGRVFCEVKLSEDAFGTAERDARHRRKRTEIYLPRLEELVDSSLLHEPEFFRNYQLLRNISLLADNPKNHLVVLVPEANHNLRPALTQVIPALLPQAVERVHVGYLEQVLGRVVSSTASIRPLLLGHIEGLREKYVPTPLADA